MKTHWIFMCQLGTVSCIACFWFQRQHPIKIIFRSAAQILTTNFMISHVCRVHSINILLLLTPSLTFTHLLILPLTQTQPSPTPNLNLHPISFPNLQTNIKVSVIYAQEGMPIPTTPTFPVCYRAQYSYGRQNCIHRSVHMP